VNSLEGAWFSLDVPAASVSVARERAGVVLDLLLVGTFAVMVFLLSGIGYTGSDDMGYIGAAREWRRHFPYVSHFFGDLRYPAILPISLSILLFGDSETTVAIPTLLYALGTVLVTCGFLRNLTDRWTAIIASLLLAASPLLGELSTTAGDDTSELFYSAVSLFIFLYATLRQGAPFLYLLAGVAAGLAFLTRESTIALLLAYGVLFLVGFGGRRRVYWLTAAGFLAVFAAEMLFYLMATGDPLHRLKLVAAAAQTPDPNDAVGAVDFHSGRVFNISPLIDPLIFVLFHPKFALISWAASCALVWTLLFRSGGTGGARFTRHFLLLGAFSFLVSAFVLGYLALIPRYFLVMVFCATVAAGLWIRLGLWPRHRPIAIGAVAILLVADLGGATVSNKSPRFAERVLASLAVHSAAPIHTDVETKFRGRDLFDWAATRDRITSEVPAPNDLFLFNPEYVGVKNLRTLKVDPADYTPKPSWTVVERFTAPQKPIVVGLELLGLDKLLPPALVNRMSSPSPVVLYRVNH
jgi:4-amino-4-deoxy-L-arabinose transferase-like glycosyltransferase